MSDAIHYREVPSSEVQALEGSVSVRILQAQDDERRKIARELHDSVGQALVAAKMVLSKIKREESIQDGSALDEAVKMLDDALAEVRTISHLLHPPDIDLAGLRRSLAYYVEGFKQRTGIKTVLEAPAKIPSLPSFVTSALFRITQECLTNIHKHAQASQVIVRLVLHLNKLQLEVNDNGKGFADLEACRQGIGILGMQERLAEIGGKLRIESGHGAGSSVFAIIPLRAETPVAVPPQSAPKEGTVRVLIVDDHPAIRYGLRMVLKNQADMMVCGEATNADQGVELAMKLQPDIVILDLQLGNASGWSVVRRLRAQKSAAKIIIFSHFAYADSSASASLCEGCVPKSADPAELIGAIRSVYRGTKAFLRKAQSA
jgi:CheY-like chemotaxis protein